MSDAVPQEEDLRSDELRDGQGGGVSSPRMTGRVKQQWGHVGPPAQLSLALG